MDPRAISRSILTSDLTTTAKLVALALLDHWSPTRPAVWPSIARLAAMSSVHRTSAIRAIAELEQRGFVLGQRSRGLPTKYVFLDQSHGATGSTERPVAQSDRSHGATGPVAPCDRTSRTVRHEVSQEVSQEDGLSARVREDQRPQLEPSPDPEPEQTVPAPPPEVQAPLSLTAALELPLAERAAALERDPHMASWIDPHRWPEVRRVAEDFAKRAQQPARIAAYHRDAGVRALVACFAAGFTEPEVARAARDAWILERGLSALTPESVRRALAKPSRAAHSRAAAPVIEIPREQRPTADEVAAFAQQVLKGPSHEQTRSGSPAPATDAEPADLGQRVRSPQPQPPRKAETRGVRGVPPPRGASAGRTALG